MAGEEVRSLSRGGCERGLREVGPRFSAYFRGCLEDPQDPPKQRMQELGLQGEQVTTTVTVTVGRDASSTALVEEEEADPFPLTLVL